MQSSLRTLMMSLVGGLLVSFGLVFALDYNDSMIISSSQGAYDTGTNYKAVKPIQHHDSPKKEEKDRNQAIDITPYPVGTILASYVDPRADDFAGFYAGSCTVYIAKSKPSLFLYDDGGRRLTGNAEDRLHNAQKLGIKHGSEAKTGAIAVYYEGRGANRYGHVGIVESLQNDGSIVISEMDYEQEHVVTYRVVAGDLAAGYIYE